MPRGQSNIGVDSLPMPTLSKSVGIIALFEKIYDGEPWMMWEVWCNPSVCHYWETIIDFKWQKQGSLSTVVLGLSQDGVCADSFENFRVKAYSELIEWWQIQPTSFLTAGTFMGNVRDETNRDPFHDRWKITTNKHKTTHEQVKGSSKWKAEGKVVEKITKAGECCKRRHLAIRVFH